MVLVRVAESPHTRNDVSNDVVKRRFEKKISFWRLNQGPLLSSEDRNQGRNRHGRRCADDSRPLLMRGHTDDSAGDGVRGTSSKEKPNDTVSDQRTCDWIKDRKICQSISSSTILTLLYEESLGSNSKALMRSPVFHYRGDQLIVYGVLMRILSSRKHVVAF